jgi:hypothetical protein
MKLFFILLISFLVSYSVTFSAFPYSDPSGSFTTPALAYGGMIYVTVSVTGGDDILRVIDGATGNAKNYTYTTTNDITSPIIIYRESGDTFIVFGDAAGVVHKVKDTGSTLNAAWTRDVGTAIRASIGLWEEATNVFRLYVANISGEVRAINSSDGGDYTGWTGEGNNPLTGLGTITGALVVSSPRRRLYIVNQAGNVYRKSCTTGYGIPSYSLTGGNFSGNPYLRYWDVSGVIWETLFIGDSGSDTSNTVIGVNTFNMQARLSVGIDEGGTHINVNKTCWAPQIPYGTSCNVFCGAANGDKFYRLADNGSTSLTVANTRDLTDGVTVTSAPLVFSVNQVYFGCSNGTVHGVDMSGTGGGSNLSGYPKPTAGQNIIGISYDATNNKIIVTTNYVNGGSTYGRIYSFNP